MADTAFAIHRIDPSKLHLFDRIAPEVFDEAVDSARLRDYVADEANLMVLAVAEGSGGAPLVVGQCAAVLHRHPDKPTELYVDELGTAATHRRQGIGRALMLSMIEWGREKGCGEGWLATELDNLPARSLYDDLLGKSEEIVMYEIDLS